MLRYEPWWYETWIRPMIFEAENEMSGMIFFDEKDREWKIRIQWDCASDETQEKMGKNKTNGLPFHTHPHCAYISNHTTRGDPSLTDLLMYLRHLYQYGHNTHVIFAKEGMYYISATHATRERLSPTALESLRLHLENYPDWDKTHQCDSIYAVKRCRQLSEWIRKYFPGIKIRFYDYMNPTPLWCV